MSGKVKILGCTIVVALLAITSWGAASTPKARHSTRKPTAVTRAAVSAPTTATGAAAVAGSPNAMAHYAMDTGASSLSFEFTQAGARTVGKFKSVSGTLDRADNGGIANLRVVIDVKSLDTADADRDKQLAQKDLFDVAQFPQAIFQTGTAMALVNANAARLNGSLTIRNIAKPITVPASVELQTAATTSSLRLRGQAPLKRLDFGVGQGEWKSTEWVANEVVVKFDVVYRLAAPAQKR